MTQIAFIGLGVMGFPMAGHLAQAGHSVTVYNRTTSRAGSWTDKYNGSRAETPRQACNGASIAICCVGNDNDVREVVAGSDGMLSGLAPGAIIVDHTTASAQLARELANEAAGLSVGFLDAPVSGGQAGAESGALTVMCGGSPEYFDQVKQIIDCYAKSCRLIGPSGAGQLTKMVNQICIAGLVQALAEGMSFGVNAGLDMEAVIDVVSKGAAQSWQMDNRASTMCGDEFDFGFAVDWMRKDLGICLDEAQRNGSRLPVTALVDQFYGQVQKNGGSRWDTSSLISLLK